MKKRFWFLFLFVSILLIEFASAATFSLSSVFDRITQENLIIFLTFIISFALIFFSLNKFFRGNRMIAAMVTFAMSFGITYWVSQMDFDLSGWLFDLGISSDILLIILPILAIILCIFLIAKLKRNSLLVFGGFFLLSAFFVYEKIIVIILGIVLIFIRLFFKKKRRRPYYDLAKISKKKRRKHSVSFSGPRDNWVSQRKARNRYAAEEAVIQRRMDEWRAKNLREQRRMEAEEKWRRESMRSTPREQGRKEQEYKQKYQERSQIISDIKSLINTYNEIQRRNPSDPRLMDIAKEIKRLKRNK